MKSTKSLTTQLIGVLTAALVVDPRGLELAFANQQLPTLFAELTYVHLTPSGEEEICVIPRYYETADLKYADADSDREDELKVCRLTMYEGLSARTRVERSPLSQLAAIPVKEVVACPKFISTNPGTNFVEIPKGMSYVQSQQELCVPNQKIDEDYREEFNLDAKFKSTISCSSTASALGYYHLSRVLGGAGRVPVALYRTMARQSHHEIAKDAVGFLGASSETIAQNWRNFLSASTNAAAGKINPKIYLEGGRSLYGSLQKNLKGEDKYTEVSGVGPYEGRYVRFMQQRPFQLVADQRPVEQIAVGSFAENAQTIVQMQDVSDMILMDTLMSQDDRIGNVHTKPWVLEKGQWTLRKMTKGEENALKTFKAETLKQMQKTNPKATEVRLTTRFALRATRFMFPNGDATLVAAMYLKDNDCGVDVDLRSNQMRKHKTLEAVRHMNPETYKRFLMFASEVESGRFKSFALNALTYREKDFQGARNSLLDNVKHASQVLVQACEKGDLKLDLVLSFDAQGNLRKPQPVACR